MAWALTRALYAARPAIAGVFAPQLVPLHRVEVRLGAKAVRTRHWACNCGTGAKAGSGVHDESKAGTATISRGRTIPRSRNWSLPQKGHTLQHFRFGAAV